MNPTATPFDLHGAVLRIVPHVFDTMLSLPIMRSTAGDRATGERVSGTIGITGETLSGSVYLHFSEPLARRAAAAMLGLDSPETANTGSVNDVVSELANMIGGSFKPALCDASLPCAMSTPSIVRGPAFAIELPPGLRAETLPSTAPANAWPWKSTSNSTDQNLCPQKSSALMTARPSA